MTTCTCESWWMSTSIYMDLRHHTVYICFQSTPVGKLIILMCLWAYSYGEKSTVEMQHFTNLPWNLPALKGAFSVEHLNPASCWCCSLPELLFCSGKNPWAGLTWQQVMREDRPAGLLCSISVMEAGACIRAGCKDSPPTWEWPAKGKLALIQCWLTEGWKIIRIIFINTAKNPSLLGISGFRCFLLRQFL